MTGYQTAKEAKGKSIGGLPGFGKPTEVPLGVIYVQEGESLLSALNKVQLSSNQPNSLIKASRMYGMPMSKSIRYYCPLCLQSVPELEAHFFAEHSTKQQVIPNGSEIDVQFKSLFADKEKSFPWSM